MNIRCSLSDVPSANVGPGGTEAALRMGERTYILWPPNVAVTMSCDSVFCSISWNHLCLPFPHGCPPSLPSHKSPPWGWAFTGLTLVLSRMDRHLHAQGCGWVRWWHLMVMIQSRTFADQAPAKASLSGEVTFVSFVAQWLSGWNPLFSIS